MMIERADETQGLGDARRDQTTAKLVEVAVAIAEAKGKPEAAAFLHQHGVNFSVTVRTLSETLSRRALPHRDWDES